MDYSKFINTKAKKIILGIFFGMAFFSIYLPLMILHYCPQLDMPLMLIKGLAVIVFFALAMYMLYKEKRIPLFLWLMNAICILNIIVTYIYDGYIVSAIWGNFLLLNSLILMIFIGFRLDARWFLQILIVVLSLVLAGNTFTIIRTWQIYGEFFPFGVEQETLYLCGNYNGFICWYFPLQMLIYVYMEQYKKDNIVFRTFFIGISLIILVSLYRVGSLTSFAVFLILDIVLLMSYIKQIRKGINIYTFLLVDLAIFLGFVVFRIMEIPFIADILSKLRNDVTLSGRTYIWDATKNIIMLKPWFGYGLEHQEVMYERFLGYENTHNLYLQLIYEGGIIELLLYVAIAVLTVKKLRALKDMQICAGIEMFLGAFFLSFVTEIHINFYRFAILAIICFLSELITKKRLNAGEWTLHETGEDKYCI